jgi:hypothetical protein
MQFLRKINAKPPAPGEVRRLSVPHFLVDPAG